MLFSAAGFVFVLLLGVVVGMVAYNYSENYILNEKTKADKKHMKPIHFLLPKGGCCSKGAGAYKWHFVCGMLNGILWITIFMANGYHLRSIVYCLMTSAFLAISIIDDHVMIIPLECNGFILLLGILNCIIDFSNIWNHIIGFFSVSAFLYLLYLISSGRAIGGGDVKLMAVGGLLLGWKWALLGFFGGCIIGSVCHIIRMRVSKAERVLAMGPYLCIGLWIASLWGESFFDWYFGLMK